MGKIKKNTNLLIFLSFWSKKAEKGWLAKDIFLKIYKNPHFSHGDGPEMLECSPMDINSTEILMFYTENPYIVNLIKSLYKEQVHKIKLVQLKANGKTMSNNKICF